MYGFLGFSYPLEVPDCSDPANSYDKINADLGQQVKYNSDMVHGHAMPFYHGKNEEESWDCVAGQVKWYSDNIGLPALISESQRAWGHGGDHGDCAGDVGPSQYSNYWHSFYENCAFFKQYQTGWFIHAWAQESTFRMVKDDGSYAMPPWKPKRC